MLTSKKKRMLRARGNQLKAEVWIGRQGVTEGSITTIENSFKTKELIKIKIQDGCALGKEKIANIICRKTGGELIQVLGNTLLFFRPFPEQE
jgi:RNA-binding protein